MLNAVVIGIGNDYRRDDGVGPAVATAISQRKLPGVHVVTGIEDPMDLLDAWSDAALAVVIDAAVASPSTPGRIHRDAVNDVVTAGGVSTHGLDVTQAFALGRALGREPGRLVVFTIEAADTSHGVGLTPQVAAAVPDVVAAAVAEIGSGS
ncbi:hydrogenase maturation protease [Mycobacterium haemophilum]|uniref:Peptidase M52 n=1 Tax=Mycobacterium haemophilum TaxID=29311 RepID=A0A0I9UC40_9MYCO|nr:hydrogenase maturation protease [Mycobacterium haemophilum]KLO33496.1 peptidase M52 [Mycobacterium haemophilum]KLO39023.1 peptidase M52 [Mycobacterium haemophilum]KLO45437.1 peptidase M52 [Mycobacterium haemophilum]KLO56588.1 peptidase M52 [Mycobacterium haemophilum]